MFTRRVYEENKDPKGGAGGAAAGGGTDPKAGAGAGAADPGGKSALAGGGEPTIAELIPERLRVVKDDKSFDLEGSARKLAGAYLELDKRLKAGEAPPATPDEYAVDQLPGEVKFDELRKDPKMQGWLKGAHALGMNNKQIKHVLTGLLEYNAADGELTAQETTAELQKHWKGEGEFKAKSTAAYRATNALAAKIGSSYKELDDRFGNDPLFIRLMAEIGAEMKEDPAPRDAQGGGGSGDFETRRAELLKKLDSMPSNDPQRAAVMAEWNQLFEARYGKAAKAA